MNEVYDVRYPNDFERMHSTQISISHSFPDIGVQQYDVLIYIGWVYDATGGSILSPVLYRILYTGYFTQDTLHRILYIEYFTQDTLHRILYTGYFTQDTMVPYSLNKSFLKPLDINYFERMHFTQISISHSFPDIDKQEVLRRVVCLSGMS